MTDIQAYENLANAIIIQAAKDYKKAYKKSLRRGDCERTKQELAELEGFFRSEWYRTLTSLDGELVMEKLRKVCER